MIGNSSGRRWARFALIFGAAMSVLGNETHTFLTLGAVNLPIRIVLAFIWPTALFVAVEVLVRVNWRNRFIDYAGRAVMMIPVSMVAAVVSYQHLHALMLQGGEDSFSAAIGPLAIDGLMIGGTVALLAIRAASLVAVALEPIDAPELDEALDRWVNQHGAMRNELEEHSEADWSRAAEVELGQAMLADEIAPVSPAPLERAPRAPRATWNAAEVCELAVREVKAGEASAQTGIGQSTYGRYLKVARILKADPRASVEGEKVPSAHVAIMRELVSK
jgi:hypothetical protein